MKPSPYLDGQLLIAMPSIGDPRFHRSVIYLCAHSDKGAMGLIVNKPAPSIYFADLLDRLDVLSHDERVHLPTEIGALPVQFGGPVEPGRGFVLHTSDYFSPDTTLPIDERTGLTATLDILRAIAKGTGPRRKLLALGYSGWGPGQLDEEIQHNGWLHCAADEELMFGGDFDGKYNSALGKIGVDPALLSGEAGHG